MQPKYQGLSFETLRTALVAMYWYTEGMSEDVWKNVYAEKRTYVVPMQHNWENPIKAETGDTYIQYWIDRDDRLVQDYNDGAHECVLKQADVSLRFLGAQGEQWAKAFHHITKRNTVWEIFAGFCNGEVLEYVRPIVPVNVDYFGVGNTVIAFATGFSMKYVEYMDLSDLRKPLEYIALPQGAIV